MPLKILHIADIHFNPKQFEWIWRHRLSVDAVCITGDFLDTCIHALPLFRQIAWIQEWMNKFDSPLFVCSGNHDFVEDEKQPSLEELFSGYDDEIVGIDEGNIAHTTGSVGWLTSLDNINVITDGQIRNINGYSIGCIGYGASSTTLFKNCDILLTHVPPATTGISIDKTGEDFGCHEMLRQLKQGHIAPGYLLSGHIHQPIAKLEKLKDTWLSNPGSKPSAPVPLHNILAL